MQLGRIDGWPRWAKIVLPLAAGALVWWLASWLLAWLDIIPNPVSAAHRLEESLVIGLGSYLVWKFLAAALLVLHLLNTYIYFGKHPFWNYVNATAQTLLAPLRKIPLRAGRVDFAPVVGIVLVFFAAELARARSRPGFTRGCRFENRSVRFGLGQLDGDGRARAFAAVNRKRAAVQFGQPLGDDQAQAQPLLLLQSCGRTAHTRRCAGFVRWKIPGPGR